MPVREWKRVQMRATAISLQIISMYVTDIIEHYLPSLIF